LPGAESDAARLVSGEGSTGMTCREIFIRLSEYLDEELSEELCRAIQAHMARCQPCETFARSLRRTVEFCRQLPTGPVPDDVRRELITLLEREGALA
jgi:anti-sigma factor RsiW